jgi:hypothetical protein
MPLYFIEMGQGLISRGNFCVRTSALFSCTLICGHNSRGGEAGAFHYPAEARNDQDTVNEMNIWAHRLNPTHIILVYPPNNPYQMQGVGPDDQEFLEAWAAARSTNPVATRNTGSAGMKLHNNVMTAGRINDLGAGFDGGAIDLSGERAGRSVEHGGYTLLGRNQEG